MLGCNIFSYCWLKNHLFVSLLTSLLVNCSSLNAIEQEDATLKIKAMINKNLTVLESFSTNVDQSTIVAQFQLADGVVCWLLYDFKNDVKVFKVDVLGETELGQKQYQSMCFVTKLDKTDIIPPDAMAKLRQKSSGSLQEPNEILKSEDVITNMEFPNLDLPSEILGTKFHQMCAGRESFLYARESELPKLVRGDQKALTALRSARYRRSDERDLSHCSQALPNSKKFQPCLCRVQFVVAWYPCVVKYCQSKNAQGIPITTRCGIRSCRKTYQLSFVANHPLSCHWGVT